MNLHPGVIGKKLGMTQIFNEDGTVTPCTVVEAKPVVVGKRTRAKDGYDALVLGLGTRAERHTSKPLAGHYKKANIAPAREVRELRCKPEELDKYELGAAVALDTVFEAGQFVDVQGVTRGRGFTGVMRRHHVSGFDATHGTHEYRRHGGSIGMRKTPGKVWKGHRMSGHYGTDTRSVLNQRVVKVVPEEHLLLVSGGIPGARNSTVVVRGAVKRRGGKKAS